MMTAKQTLLLAAIGGALFVIIGAFGAHGAPTYLERHHLPAEQIEKRLHDLEVGVRYHAYHVFALLGLGLWLQQTGRRASCVGPLFVGGTLLFSGFLYAFVITGARPLVIIVPLGGLLLIVGWSIWAWQIVTAPTPSVVFRNPTHGNEKQ